VAAGELSTAGVFGFVLRRVFRLVSADWRRLPSTF
jgi:hypothetical protein